MPLEQLDSLLQCSSDVIRVMVVDDQAIVRDVLQAHFSGEGYECTQAENVGRAKEILVSNRFDACFIDVHMPGESGLDLLVHLCYHHPDTVAIMLTGVYDANMAVTAMKFGAYDYVTKPFERSDLLMRLQQALEKQHLKLENRLYREKLEELVEQRTKQLHKRNEQLEQLTLSTIESFALALQLRNEYTEGHSQRVAYWCVQMANEMGLDPHEQHAIHHAALLHDMGKMAIRDDILDKPSALTDEEYQDIQRHPTLARDILEPILSVSGRFQVVVDAIVHHHEHYDGRGYPDGLKGNAIPLLARVISVADAYDSMANRRAYRDARPPELVIEELERCTGTQFDPEVVRAFVKCHAKVPSPPIRCSGEIVKAAMSHPALTSYVLYHLQSSMRVTDSGKLLFQRLTSRC